MKKYFISIMIITCFLQVEAQKKKKKEEFNAVKITYQVGSNGKFGDALSAIMDICGNIAEITYGAKPNDPVQKTYIDYNTLRELRTADINGDQKLYTVKNFNYDSIADSGETEIIEGYKCKKIEKSINSNKIEIWYTTDLGMEGSMQPGTSIPHGVVLKIVRNGSRVEQAMKVEKYVKKEPLLPVMQGEELTARAYNYRLQQSKVVTVDVFKNESIYYRDIPKHDKLSDTEIMRFAGGTILLKKVKLPEKNSNYSIFAELSQFSEGDAYDRTGSVFMIPVNKKQSFIDGLLQGKEKLPIYTDKHGNNYEGYTVTDDYLPPLELMRFYTTFGVKGFNHIEVADYIWPDSVMYKQEITDCAQMLKGEVWVGTWVGNYAQNAHNVTLKIKYYPSWGERTNKIVYPLFATVNIMEMAGQAYPEHLFRNDSLTFKFKTDTDLKNAYIRYITTGHGGWGGGDEFNPKINSMFINGNRVIDYTPWREDCACYRNLNPASGNFPNGLSSSDLSRSGWCPGTVSYPILVNIGSIKAGEHTLKLAIPVGDPEGTSRSYWCTSGALVGEKQ